MATQRPTGITILAVLQFIGGVTTLIFGLSSVFLGGTVFAAGIAQEAGEMVEVGPIMFGIGIASILLGIFGLIAAYGLFALKGWGWTLAIFYSIFNVLQGIISLFQGPSVPGAIVSLVISGLIIYYLNQSRIKRAFGKA